MNTKTNIIFCIICLLFAACNNTSNQREITHEHQDSSKIDSVGKTDSTLVINNSCCSKDTNITVSFKGLAIGSSIQNYLGKTIPRSSRIEKLDSYCRFIFNTNITINSVQIPTEVNVYCINDTISLIVAYIFPDYKNRDKFYELKDMYLTKYGESCKHSFLSDYSKSFIQLKNIDDHYGDVQIWDFNHVAISLIQVNHNWIKEDYEIDSYGNRVYKGLIEETLYGDKFIVVYSHKETFTILLREIHKWNDYSKRQIYLQDSIQREKQLIQDSIEMNRKRKIVIHDANQI